MKEIYPLRLPRSLKKTVERLSREDGTSINQFVATAVAEKVSALETARFFEDRREPAMSGRDKPVSAMQPGTVETAEHDRRGQETEFQSLHSAGFPDVRMVS